MVSGFVFIQLNHLLIVYCEDVIEFYFLRYKKYVSVLSPFLWKHVGMVTKRAWQKLLVYIPQNVLVLEGEHSSKCTVNVHNFKKFITIPLKRKWCDLNI